MFAESLTMQDIFPLVRLPNGNQPWLDKTVYIAGPMRGIEKYNFPAFDAARDELLAEGYIVISPADVDRARGFNETSVWSEDGFHVAMRVDVKAVLSVDLIYLLPGWSRSTGAKFERTLADHLGIEVRYAPDAEVRNLGIVVDSRPF